MIINVFRLGAICPESGGYLSGAICPWGEMSGYLYDSPVLTTPFLLRLRSYRRFSRMYNTRVRFACPIYFSRDQSSSKLIIFLDWKLERSNSRVAKIDLRLDFRNFRGSRIESRVEFRNSRVTVNLPLSGTVHC